MITNIDINRKRLKMTNKQIEVFMSVKGARNIKALTLVEFIDSYNKTCDKIGDRLQVFFTRNEAQEHLNKFNQ